MKWIKWLSWLVLLPFLLVAIFLGYSIVNDFRPDTTEDSLDFIRNGRPFDQEKTIEVTTFNIGYAGLDASRDFFMEGGKDSRAESAAATRNNLKGVIDFMKAKKSDIYLLQEVDTNALRSFKIDEADAITSALRSYNASFAYNYKTKWVPIPIHQPMGGVESGMMTLSQADFDHSKRYSLPGKAPIIQRYFDLKRCVMENTYTLSNGKKLIVMNVHLSAYDKDGKARSEQIDWLIEHIDKVYREENAYYIIGGDWNHLMSQAIQDKIEGELPVWAMPLPEKLVHETGFKIVCDESVSSSRSNDKPYIKGKSFETTIDGFLISPNLKVLSIKGTDLGYQHSDHNPVTIQLAFE